jgi:thioesterase domain-containing protein
LAAVIDKDQPLFLVQNYNAFVCKRENTEELAKRYFNLLTKKYPAREYLIGGACYGAIISILLAKLLLDHGYKVRPLILVEAINLNDAEISAINSALNYRLSPQETLL